MEKRTIDKKRKNGTKELEIIVSYCKNGDSFQKIMEKHVAQLAKAG